MKPRGSYRYERLFERQLEEWGVALGEERLEKLALYARELSAYDRANVIGVRDLEKIWVDHILDSLSCKLYRPLGEARSLVDVGSGGGMPGLPLHVALEPKRTCLLESTRKKAEFLRHAASRLQADRVEIANGRAEEFGQSEGYRASFEVATVRAVAPLEVVAEYCMPFLSLGGVVIAMKGRMSPEERSSGERAAILLGGTVEEIIRVPISQELEQKERCLVVIRKERSTPEQYPRKSGVPKKSPLGSET